MMEREQKIALGVFAVLKRMPGGQCAESVLFESVATIFKNRGEKDLLRGEFDQVVRECEGNGWLAGLYSAMGTRKWAITDLGKVLENL